MERLSGMDAFFLYLESPTQHMHVTLCAVLDPAEMPGGFSFERIRDHVASRIHLIPPFRRRLVPVPLNLHHPLWVDDPAFEVEYHVRRAAVPSPGSPAELARLTEQLAGIPLDRARPLWELWVVEGLADDRFALVVKAHHSTLDGVAGVEQLVTLFDFDRAGREIEPPAAAPAEEIPGDLELLTFAAVSKVVHAFEALPLLGRTASSVLAVRRSRQEAPPPPQPDGPAPASHRDEPPRSRAVGGTPLTAPHTVLNGTISGQRCVAFTRIPLDGIKALRGLVEGATVNDVIMAVCAGALRRYLLAHDELPSQPLVAACPVNVRTEDQQGHADNRVSAMFVALPTHLTDPVDRLRTTHETARAAKDEHALFEADTLQRWAEIADPNLFSWLSDLYVSSGLANRHRPAINVMISNVPGPPFPLYLAGAELTHAYPMGPIIEGVGLNITVMSYRDAIDFGFMAAANLVRDVDELAAMVVPAFDELLAALDHRSADPDRVTVPPRARR